MGKHSKPDEDDPLKLTGESLARAYELAFSDPVDFVRRDRYIPAECGPALPEGTWLH